MDAVKEEMIKQDERGEPMDAVKAAEAVAQRLEAANQRAQELFEQQEKARARDILSGRASAGTKPTPEPEISDLEYARLALQGKIPKRK